MTEPMTPDEELMAEAFSEKHLNTNEKEGIR